MKIIKYTPSLEGGGPTVDIMPDSALQKSGKPFFVPDFSDRFVFAPTVAVHVCRLGKNIAVKFASRYYDEVGVCLTIEAHDMLERLKSEQKPWVLASGFDGSVIVGDFMPAAGNSDKLQIAVAVDGDEVLKGEVEAVGRQVDAVIEYISRYFTLKIGDYILLDLFPDRFDMAINSHVLATIQGMDSVNIRVK